MNKVAPKYPGIHISPERNRCLFYQGIIVGHDRFGDGRLRG